MIKKLLTMSAGIVLGSLITTTSHAGWPHSPDCNEARDNHSVVMNIILNCKEAPEAEIPDHTWKCEGWLPRTDATAMKNLCMQIVRLACPGQKTLAEAEAEVGGECFIDYPQGGECI